LSSGSLVVSCDAIIPAIVKSAKSPVTMLNSIIPKKEAKTNLKNCFIKRYIITVYLAKIYIIDVKTKLFTNS
jgi:hypothetical protein